MKTKKIITLFALFVIPISIFSQVTPDSLIGTYAGKCWFKWEEDLNWTITDDTAYIVEVFPSTCSITHIYPNKLPSGGSHFETLYDFCYGISENWFTRFYSADSIKVVYNEVSQPPPNVHVWSSRFFGKKISSDILLGVEEAKKDLITIFPNPFNDILNVELPERADVEIKLFNITGKKININVMNNNNKIKINSKLIPQGIYILQISFNKKINSYKIIKL